MFTFLYFHVELNYSLIIIIIAMNRVGESSGRLEVEAGGKAPSPANRPPHHPPPWHLPPRSV
jgi:hypothetical protein